MKSKGCIHFQILGTLFATQLYCGCAGFRAPITNSVQGQAIPSPSVSPTPSASPSVSPTPSASPSVSPTPSASPSPLPSPSASSTPQPVPFRGATATTNPGALLSGFLNAYAPSLISNFLYFGGWLTEQDHAVGDDRLYFSVRSNNSWQSPQPLQWTNANYLPGYVRDYHANDPSVIRLNNNGSFYMYYTLLANEYSTTYDDMVSYNQVGFASSTDGLLWTARETPIIGQFNGLDETGAWAPSAQIVGSEIWLYYHTGAGCNIQDCNDVNGAPTTPLAPRLLRTRFAMDGFTPLGTQEITDWEGHSLRLIAVDVQFAFGRYWMVGNTDLNHIALYLSDDGMRFYPYDGQEGLLLNGGPNVVLTPNIQVSTANTIAVSFGFGSNFSNSIHTWTFDLYR